MKLREWQEREVQANPDYAAAAAEIEFAQSIADRVVAGRIAAKLTQAKLAERAGTTQARISEIEAGDGNPTVETVAKVFAALGLCPTVTVTPLDSDRATAMVPSTSTEAVGAMDRMKEFVIVGKPLVLRATPHKHPLEAVFEEGAYARIEIQSRLERVA